MIELWPRAAATARIATALGAKDLRLAWSYRLSFLLGHLSVFGSMIVFYFVSKVVGETELFDGPEAYFQFVVIGMALASLVDRALSAAMGAARSDQVQGTLEAIAALPVPSLSLGLGWVTYPLIDGVIGAIVTILIAIPFGLSGADANWLGIIVVAALSVGVFTALGLIGAGIVLAFQQGGGAIAFVIGGLGLVSGTMFPVSVLPPWLQVLSDLSPLRYSLDAMRAVSLDGQSLGDISHPLTVLLLFFLVLLPISLFSLEAGMARARKTGGLGRF